MEIDIEGIPISNHSDSFMLTYTVNIAQYITDIFYNKCMISYVFCNTCMISPQMEEFWKFLIIDGKLW